MCSLQQHKSVAKRFQFLAFYFLLDGMLISEEIIINRMMYLQELDWNEKCIWTLSIF